MKAIALSFRQIDFVLAVAETGSTAAAGRSLNVSQPSVSLAVSRVEETFGQTLFFRASGQGMELTSFGRRKLVELRALRAQARTVLAETGGASSRLDLGVFSTLGPRYAPALVRGFRDRHPRADIRLHEGDLETLFTWLEAGRIDLALIYDFGVPRDLEIVPLRDVRPYGLVRADHPLARCDTVGLEDLLRDPLVLIDLPHSRAYFLSLAQMHGVSVRIAHETGSVEMVRAMVANGLGVGLLATEIPHDTAYDGSPVVSLPLKGELPPHRIALARPASVPPGELHKNFVKFAVRELR